MLSEACLRPVPAIDGRSVYCGHILPCPLHKIDNVVDHPAHYTHPSGVECIQVTEHMNFCRGNAIKYIWRAGSKGKEIEDLRKARWYIDREIARLEKEFGK